MPAFRRGQSVSFRGQQGVVEAVDLTPGMVDVSYPNGLVKRHRADALESVARPNSSRYEKRGRKPRRSRRSAGRRSRFSRSAYGNPFKRDVPHATGEDLERLRAAQGKMGLPERVTQGEAVDWGEYKARLATSLARMERLLATGPKMPSVPRTVPKQEARKIRSLVPIQAQLEREQEKLERRVAFVEQLQAMGPAGLRELGIEVGPGAKTFTFWQEPMIEASGWKISPDRRAELEAMAQGSYLGKPSDEIPSFEEQEAARIELEESAPRPQTPVLGRAEREELTRIAQGQLGPDGETPTASEVREAHSILEANAPKRVTLKSKDGKFKLPTSIYYEGQFHSTNVQDIQSKIGKLTLLQRQLEGRLPLLKKQVKVVAAIERQGHYEELEKGDERYRKTADDLLSDYREAAAEREERKKRGARAHRLEGKKAQGAPLRRKQQMRSRAAESAAAVGLTKEGYETPASFVVLPDPPRFEGGSAGADQTLCGNPIDGSMYVLRLSGMPRAIGHLLTRAEVAAYKQQWVLEGNEWPETVAAMTEALSEMMNPTVEDSSRKRGRRSLTDGSWRVTARKREEHPHVDPESPPKKDFYSEADVKLIQEGELIVTTPKEEQRTFQGREGSPGPERDLRFEKRILTEQVEAAKKSMAFPLGERLRIALQAETTREQQAAQNSILRRTKERLAGILDREDVAYRLLEEAEKDQDERGVQEASAAVIRAKETLAAALVEEEEREQKWAMSLVPRLAKVTAEIDEIEALQQQLRGIWENKVYPWKQRNRKTGGFRVIQKKITNDGRTWEQAEQAWAEIRDKLASKGVRVERTIPAGRTKVRRSKAAWVRKGAKKGHGKDVSRPYLDPSTVPPSTHFEKMAYPEDDPNFGADHWVTFQAWKKIPAALKKLVDGFNPPYDPASAKRYSPFFSWVRLDRSLAAKRIVKTRKGVEQEIPADPYRTPPVCVNEEQRALIEIAKQLRRPTSEMAGHLRWLYRELTHDDPRTREQLARVGDRSLGVAAWFGNWAQNASESVARVPKRYEKQVPELKVLRAMQKRGSEEQDGLPYKELAATIVTAPLPFVVLKPGTVAKIVGLREIDGARGAKTRDVPPQFAPIPFAPGIRRYETLKKEEARLVEKAHSGKAGARAHAEKELTFVRTQLAATFVEQLLEALPKATPESLADLIIEKQNAGGLFPPPKAPLPPKPPKKPKQGAAASTLKRYKNALKRYNSAVKSYPKRMKAATERFAAYTQAQGTRYGKILNEIRTLKLFPDEIEVARRSRVISRAADAETARDKRAAEAFVKEIRQLEYDDSVRVALYFIFASLGGQKMIQQLMAAQHTLRILIANGGRVPPPGTMSRRYAIAALEEEEAAAAEEKRSKKRELSDEEKRRAAARSGYRQGTRKSILREEASTLVGLDFQIGRDPLYYTFNPALFQITQRYWNSHPPWPSTPGSAEARQEAVLEFEKVDAVGRYGAALTLAYESGLHASDVEEMKERMAETIGAEDFLSELASMIKHALEPEKQAERTKKMRAVKRTARGMLSPRKSFGRGKYRYLDLLSEGRAGAGLIERGVGAEDQGWMVDLAQRGVPVELLAAEAEEIAIEPHAYLSSLRKRAQQALIRSQADSEAVSSGVRLQGGKRDTVRPIPPITDMGSPPYKVKRRGKLSPVDSHYPQQSALAALQFAPGDANELLALIQKRLKQLHGARHRADRQESGAAKKKTRKPRKKR